MQQAAVKYPHVTIDLQETDGNAFSIIGSVTRALRKGGLSPAEIEQETKALTSSKSYDELLSRVMQLVETGGDD